MSIWLQHFFGTISKTNIGIFPLDTILHILVGAIITYVGLKLKFSFRNVFIFLLIIESIKATFAAMTISHDFLHGLKEFFATFLYPAWVWMVRRIKARAQKSPPQNVL